MHKGLSANLSLKMSFKDYEKAKESTTFFHPLARYPWLLGIVCCFVLFLIVGIGSLSQHSFISVTSLTMFSDSFLRSVTLRMNTCLSSWDVCSKPAVSTGFCVPSWQSLESRCYLNPGYLDSQCSQKAEILAHGILKYPVDVGVLIICHNICKICSILILIQVVQRPVEYEWWQTLFMHCPWMWPGNGLTWSY